MADQNEMQNRVEDEVSEDEIAVGEENGPVGNEEEAEVSQYLDYQLTCLHIVI